jgi:hypothetical protein
MGLRGNQSGTLPGPKFVPGTSSSARSVTEPTRTTSPSTLLPVRLVRLPERDLAGGD